jgi:molybdopterin-binding protein
LADVLLEAGRRDPQIRGAEGEAEARSAARTERREIAGLTAEINFRGTIVSMASRVCFEVVLRLEDGGRSRVVTRSSVKRLGLKKGQNAMAVIKATEVMLFS